MDWGNASDLASAGCNIVMASAAVYAAFNAKRWFSQRSHTKGFDKAEEILTQIDSLFRETVDGITELHTTLEFLNTVSGNLTLADHSLMEKYECLASNHNNLIQNIDRLSEEVELIERWSIKIKNQHIIHSTIKAFRYTHVSASHAYNAARGAIYDINFMSKEDFEIMLKHYKKFYEEFLYELAEAELQYGNFKKQKFTSFFKVN